MIFGSGTDKPKQMIIEYALFIDILVLVICATLLVRFGGLSHSHPAVSYLIFHLITVTFRLISLANGAPTLFEWYFLPYLIFEPVTHTEIIKASLMIDVMLVAMTIGWIHAATVEKKSKVKDLLRIPQITLSINHIWIVASISFLIGILGIYLYGYVPFIGKSEVDLGDWESSSWLQITMTWSGLALLALIYSYGFRWWLVSPMLIYLLIMSVQGYHRFRVVIPIVLLIQIYLDRQRRKWPSLVPTAIACLVILVFFPLKNIGRSVQMGTNTDEIVIESSESLAKAFKGEHGDTQILDITACAITLVDRSGKFYYGSTYLPLLVAPVPRQLWEEKPGQADHIKEFSTPQRPMFEMGMVTGFVGDVYLNFWYIGIIVIPYLVAYGLGRFYFKAYRSNYFSVFRFAYLLIACNLIQVYRDGLMSIVIFTAVNMMPLTIIVMLHWIFPVNRQREFSLTTLLPSLQSKRSSS